MRIGDTVYHSVRVNESNAEVAEYGKPQPIRTSFNYFSVMPASSRGFMQVMRYGEDIDSTWVAIANYQAFNGKIKVGDLFWLDGEKPIAKLETEYGNGATATAVVKSVDYVNYYISITLTRNKDKVTQ